MIKGKDKSNAIDYPRRNIPADRVFPSEPEMRAGGEKRGNSKNRRSRKNYLLSPESGFGGTGETVAELNKTGGKSTGKVPCVHCQVMLDYETVEADRINIGQSYRRDNVQPSCRRCNSQRSNNPDWAGPDSVVT